jgi:hypothetical protein
VHLLGDSFSHRRRDDPTRMYAAGLGHYYDNRDPDLILYNRKDPKANRSELWMEYMSTLAGVLGIPPETLPRATLQAMVDANMPAEPDEFNEPKLRAALKKIFGIRPGGTDYDWAPFKTPVEELTAKEGWWRRHVLWRSCKEALRDLYGGKLPPGYDTIDCGRIWKDYTDVAVTAFGDMTPVCPLGR